MADLVIGAGFFCDVEPCFARLNGVIKTRLAYSSDKKNVKTPAVEVVEIFYNPDILMLSELLDLFFMIHDPTTINRQGHHKGHQYASTLFYSNQSEKELMMSKIRQVTPYFKGAIMTRLLNKNQFQFILATQQKCNLKSLPKITEVNKERFLQQKLSPEQYWIMRGKGTEPPFSGEYLYADKKGVYTCAACGQKIFLSDYKFQSNCGWPAFDKALPKSIIIQKDLSHFMVRDEVLCQRCCSHLGHVFNDGPTQTGLRFCINSLALDFKLV